jgi:hypothetical protein
MSGGNAWIDSTRHFLEQLLLKRGKCLILRRPERHVRHGPARPREGAMTEITRTQASDRK